MTALPAPIVTKVAKIIGRFGSDADGEIVAAGRALVRTLDGAGLGLADLVEHVQAAPRAVRLGTARPSDTPHGPKSYGDWRGAWRPSGERPHPAPERDRIVRCQHRGAGHLSTWERCFLESLILRLDRLLCLTPRQRMVLSEIESKLEAATC